MIDALALEPRGDRPSISSATLTTAVSVAGSADRRPRPRPGRPRRPRSPPRSASSPRPPAGRCRRRARGRSRASPPRSRGRRSRSRRRAGSRLGTSSSSSRQSRVVACAPVPNARPGSITTGDRVRRRAAPTAARPRAARPAPAGGTRASGPPSPPRRRSTARRRTPTRAAPPRGRPCRRPARRRRSASRSSKPSGKSSSMIARARSASAAGTVTETRAASAERALQLVEEPLVVWPVRLLVGASARTRSSRRRCSSVRRRGTTTLTSRRWSPRPRPWSTGMPAPRITRTSPGCAPGSNSSSTSPSIVGTVAVVAQRSLRDRQVDLRDQVVALADEARVGPDADEHVQVAGAPAELAGVALAAEPDALAVVDPRRDLDREPSAPRRRARRRRTSCTGCSTMRPVPPQRAQVCARTNWPKTVFDTCWTRPAPPQVGQRDRAACPARRRCRRTVRRGRRRGAARPGSTPRAESTSSITTSAAMSAPRAAPRGRPPTPNRSSPKNAEKRSPSVPKSKLVGVEAPAAQAGVAEAVVQLAALGVREHLVGLDHLLEAVLRVRILGDVGVQLPGERRGRPS